MADMGFLPQVDWVLRRIEKPHQTMLFSATLDGDVDRLVRRHLTDPVRHEVASARVTVDPMEHRFLPGPPDGQGQGGRRHLPGGHQGTRLRPHQARRRPPGRAAPAGEGPGRRHPRRPAPVEPGEGPARLHRRPSSRCWWPPTWPPGASTSRTSTSSSTTTRPRTTRPTCTVRAAPPGPAASGVVATLVLWDQILEVERIQKRLGLRRPHGRDLLQRPPPGRPLGLARRRRRRRLTLGSGFLPVPHV